MEREEIDIVDAVGTIIDMIDDGYKFTSTSGKRLFEPSIIFRYIENRFVYATKDTDDVDNPEILVIEKANFIKI